MKKKRPRKPRVELDHEQKRQLARQVVGGKMVKQVAVEWGISLMSAYNIVQEYTIAVRIEKYP